MLITWKQQLCGYWIIHRCTKHLLIVYFPIKAGYTAQDALSMRLKITRDGRTDLRTDGPTDRRTDGRTDTPSYRDATAHLKKKGNEKIIEACRFFPLLRIVLELRHRSH